MKARFAFILMTAALLLAMFAFMTVASEAATRTRYAVTADRGIADFTSYDATGYIRTEVAIFAVDAAVFDSLAGKSTEHQLNVDIGVYDEYHGVCLIDAHGMTNDFQFDLKNNLSSAHLTAKVALLNWWEPMDVDVDLQWNASDRIQRTAQDSIQHSPGIGTVIRHTSWLFQPCVCFGTVSDGTTNYTPNSETFSGLERAVEEVTLTAPH